MMNQSGVFGLNFVGSDTPYGNGFHPLGAIHIGGFLCSSPAFTSSSSSSLSHTTALYHFCVRSSSCLQAFRFMPDRVERMSCGGGSHSQVWDRWEWKRSDARDGWSEPVWLMPH